MVTRSDKLNRLAVESPCRTSWDGMQGDERRRYCTECGRHVHDFARMTPREIESLIAASRGRFCARITRDDQGRLVAFDPVVPAPVIPHAYRRASPVAAAVVTTFLGLGSAAAAAPAAEAPAVSPAPGAPSAGTPGPDVKPRSAQPQRAAAAGAGLRGRVVGLSGNPLAGVVVTASNTFDGRQHSMVTGEDGSFMFDALASGVYDIHGQLEGFQVTPQLDLLLQPGERREAGLQAQPMPAESFLMGATIVELDPLRKVFTDSNLVVSGKAGPSVVAERTEDYDGVVTELTVTTTLKGSAPGRSVRVYHPEPKGGGPGFAPGTKLLGFLIPYDDDSGRKDVYEFADYRFGLQAPTAAEREAYEDRVAALARLYRHGVPHPADLMEWIVATVEEPLTREGAVTDLGTALSALERFATDHETSTDYAAEDLRAVAERFLAENGKFANDPAPQLLAAFLTEVQKERLVNAFRTTPRLTEADLTLFRIVRPWAGDAAVAWLARKFHDAEPMPDPDELDRRFMSFEPWAEPGGGGLDRRIMGLLASERADAELEALIEAADAEIKGYGSALTYESTEEDKKRFEEKSAAVKKGLRSRFVQALGGRGNRHPAPGVQP